MSKTKIIIFSLAAILISAVVWAKITWTANVRYKIIITVETPEGLKSGYAVREIGLSGGPALINLPEAHRKIDVKGEAVVVDLGQRGLLFGLIDWDSYKELFSAFPMGKPSSEKGVQYYRGLKPGQKATITKGLPRLVFFEDVNEPKSVHSVDRQNLAATFGEGVSLHSYEIEITDEKVANKIEAILPWLSNLQGNYLHGGRTSRNAPLGLYGGNFQRD